MQANVTMARPASIEFLYPILGRKDAIKNETRAMGRSLNNSKVLAATSSTPYTFCDFRITMPTLFSKMAKTK
jgi:hypothetical protein